MSDTQMNRWTARIRVRGVTSTSFDAATDDDFVRALYDEHARALLGYVMRITGERTSAEDIVQETILRAWRSAGRLAADGRPLRPWLMTVARNLAIDRQRTAAASRPHAPPGALDGIAEVDHLDRALDAWQLADALRALSAEHREVLMETYYRGRSVAEAAAILGIPPGTVKSRTYYALRTLKLVLEEGGWTSQ